MLFHADANKLSVLTEMSLMPATGVSLMRYNLVSFTILLKKISQPSVKFGKARIMAHANSASFWKRNIKSNKDTTNSYPFLFLYKTLHRFALTYYVLATGDGESNF
jgi:hypothetical protein